MKMEKARIVSTSSHPSVEKNGLAIFFTSRNERTSLRLFLSGDFGATEDLARFRRGCWHDPKSEEHRAVQSILQEQPDPPLLGIRYITLCSRMGFKNMCLQRKNVRKGKRCVWGYCFSGTTQQSPVLVAKLALTLAAPCQWEVLGRHTPNSGGSHQSSGTSSGVNQPERRAIGTHHFQFKSCPQLQSKVSCWKIGASHMQRCSTMQASVERDRG